MNIAEEGPGLTRHRVFISYCSDGSAANRRDRKVANLICSSLESQGIPCWIDHRDIAPGDEWLSGIIDAVEKSKIVVLVLSENTEKSGWVKDEITLALDKNIKVIPFRIDKVEPKGALRILKIRCQWLDAFTTPMESHIELLVKAVRNFLEKEGELPPPRVPGPAVMVNQDDKEPVRGKHQIKRKNPLLLKRFLMTAAIFFSITAAVFLINQLVNRIKKPDFIIDLESRGVKVKKNEKDYWEAFYKDYDIIMIYILPGEFTMGSEDGEEDEKPLHQVYLDGYWIGKYEVTFSQYDKYCEMTGKYKPYDQGWGRENRPVINVSWDDASAYCWWLSRKTGLKFKLPTEAQWEKAARGIDSRKYPWGNEPPYEKKVNFDDKQIGLIKQYNGKYIDDAYPCTVPVGFYQRGDSPYGLMDMAGNVWEWCNDWYNKGYYENSPLKNPQGPGNGSSRVVRGGSWLSDAGGLLCAYHHFRHASDRHFDVGFRLSQEKIK